MARFPFAGTWFDGQNAVVSSGTITVYLEGTTTLATAYVSKTGAALTNSQTTTDASGRYRFWIDDGDYPITQFFRIIGTKTGFADLDEDSWPILLSNSSIIETLTNKTINGDNNTISNLAIGSEVLATPVADITMNGFNITGSGVFTLIEQAAADPDVAGRGQIWVNLATPNVLYFTDDAGTDFRLSYSVTGSGNIVLNTSPVIVTPTIASFVNAGHNHSNAAGGGTLAGSVVQMVYSLYGELATTTTILPGLNDDTIPQITEGGEFMSKAITPRSASNKLRIDVVFNGNEDANVSSCYTVALFNTNVHATNAIAAVQHEMAINLDIAYNTCFTHWMTAPGTGATTFTVRAGMEAAGTFNFNGGYGGRQLGGVLASSITITEIQA